MGEYLSIWQRAVVNTGKDLCMFFLNVCLSKKAKKGRESDSYRTARAHPDCHEERT